MPSAAHARVRDAAGADCQERAYAYVVMLFELLVRPRGFFYSAQRSAQVNPHLPYVRLELPLSHSRRM